MPTMFDYWHYKQSHIIRREITHFIVQTTWYSNYPLIEIRIKYKQAEILSITCWSSYSDNSLIFWFYKLYILKTSNKKL